MTEKARKPTATWFGAWLARPLADFHLVVTIAALLTTLGLVMVLSASSVESYADGGSAYKLFIQQALFAVIGAVLFYLALRLPLRRLRQLSFPMFAGSVLLLVLVLIPGIGSQVQGSRRWFDLGFASVQPSEVVKVTLIIWGAHLLAARRSEHANYKDIMVPLVPAGLLACLLVVLEPNLSTTIALGLILAALLWFGGLPVRLFVTIAVSGVIAAGVLALSAGYRSDRMRAFFNPGDDPQGIGYQARQALFSLADGGIWGRGLGQSRAKWSYLPNAHNDFIFAIIGEELGFLGCALVLPAGAVRAYRAADREPLGGPVPAAAHRHRDLLDHRAGPDQHRLCGGPAPGDRSAAAAGVGGRVVLGDHAVDVRHHRQRGPARTRGGGGAARRAGRPDEPVAAAAQAGGVLHRARPGRAGPLGSAGRAAVANWARASGAAPVGGVAPTRRRAAR